MNYIATFFSHYGAIGFDRDCRSKNIFCKLMPVPRSLSSSCGTCAFFKTTQDIEQFKNEDIENIYPVDENFVEDI